MTPFQDVQWLAVQWLAALRAPQLSLKFDEEEPGPSGDTAACCFFSRTAFSLRGAIAPAYRVLSKLVEAVGLQPKSKTLADATGGFLCRGVPVRVFQSFSIGKDNKILDFVTTQTLCIDGCGVVVCHGLADGVQVLCLVEDIPSTRPCSPEDLSKMDLGAITHSADARITQTREWSAKRLKTELLATKEFTRDLAAHQQRTKRQLRGVAAAIKADARTTRSTKKVTRARGSKRSSPTKQPATEQPPTKRGKCEGSKTPTLPNRDPPEKKEAERKRKRDRYLKDKIAELRTDWTKAAAREEQLQAIAEATRIHKKYLATGTHNKKALQGLASSITAWQKKVYTIHFKKQMTHLPMHIINIHSQQT